MKQDLGWIRRWAVTLQLNKIVCSVTNYKARNILWLPNSYYDVFIHFFLLLLLIHISMISYSSTDRTTDVPGREWHSHSNKGEPARNKDEKSSANKPVVFRI